MRTCTSSVNPGPSSHWRSPMMMRRRRKGGLLLVLLALWADMCVESAFHMKMVYRYSEEFKALRRGKMAGPHHRAGSMERYEHLIRRDRLRHSYRGLLATSENRSVSLSPTNETTYFDTLGGLHYSLVTIGTPGLTFLVALDTGSDLFWVPCDCQQCSSSNLETYGINSKSFDFAVYSPSNSKTSNLVLCSDTICSNSLFTKNCTNANATCNYSVTYASTNTLTAGKIVQDLLHLNLEDLAHETITTPIYFGCGEVQTGDLLNGGAPDGLFGLGPNKISIPSTLARNQVVSKSFSMCFSAFDSSGRLVFGSNDEKGLVSTSLLSTNLRVSYILSTMNLIVGEDSYEASMNFVFDTGTSFTIIPQPLYQELGQIINKKVNLTQLQNSGTFDFCWSVSVLDDPSLLPHISFTFLGGSIWTILNPYVTFNDSMLLLVANSIELTTC
eukprot:c23979_g6_i2 orf=987-2315(+)